MKCPSAKEEWEYIIDQTNNRWQFPNCYAAADGKHIGIICPKHCGSQFYNYQGFLSVVFLAFVDYDYKFLILRQLVARGELVVGKFSEILHLI